MIVKIAGTLSAKGLKARQSNAENATIKTTSDVSFDTRALAEDKKQKTFPESITGENLYFENLKTRPDNRATIPRNVRLAAF